MAVAADGPECMRKLEACRPQVAFVDIRPPGMDGYTLARELRAAAGEGLVTSAAYANLFPFVGAALRSEA